MAGPPNTGRQRHQSLINCCELQAAALGGEDGRAVDAGGDDAPARFGWCTSCALPPAASAPSFSLIVTLRPTSAVPSLPHRDITPVSWPFFIFVDLRVVLQQSLDCPLFFDSDAGGPPMHDPRPVNGCPPCNTSSAIACPHEQRLSRYPMKHIVTCAESSRMTNSRLRHAWLQSCVRELGDHFRTADYRLTHTVTPATLGTFFGARSMKDRIM
ncbi:hypothetical protein CC86DRAFT_88570 [Ophiobolus disseminans]|uniref:Uncharacterized protein n=1 Tax=Ophiobolus disseminans TaxID=1469910 RepID=A0A6A7AHD6_9PLEO|nr:hypothetical protein CC86DRAFT_88570 [Ophiobolus disseminans]